MRAAVIAAAIVAVALAVSTAEAGAATVPVTIQFEAFAPHSVDALPGDVVSWANNSGRSHTVTADSGQFISGTVADGDRFNHVFETVGTYPYYCTIHPDMTGEVDVRRVTLNPLRSSLVPAKSRLVLTGRTASPATPVRVERNTGTGFHTVATATPQTNGAWSARVVATKTATFRAATGQGVSVTRRIRVIERIVRVSTSARGVSVAVIPPAPYALVSLELLLRSRFGWWSVAHKHLDRHSHTTFSVTGPVTARVALVAPDGWTPLAVSQALRVTRR